MPLRIHRQDQEPIDLGLGAQNLFPGLGGEDPQVRLRKDSPDLANVESRPVSNLVHASGDVDEAAREIELWFPGQLE